MEETTAPAATPPPPPPPTTTTTTTTTSTANTAVPSKSLQELGMEGQKVLEATVEAAHETLASMNEVLCNPALWVTSQPTLPATVAAPSSSLAPMTSPSTLTSSSLVASTVGTSSLSGTAVTSSSSPLAESDVNRTNPSEQEAGWAALDESRLRLRSSTTSLRTVIAAIFNSPEIRDQEDSSNGLIDQSDPDELEKLEKRVAELREEVMNKNKVVKVLIDELRDFISDISMWQSSSL